MRTILQDPEPAEGTDRHGTTDPDGHHGPLDTRRVDRRGDGGRGAGSRGVPPPARRGLLRGGHRGRGPRTPGGRAAAGRRARDPAPPDRGRVSAAPALPETAAVHWRPRADARRLRSRGRTWTLTTFAHTVPFVATAGGLFALEPLSFPVGLAALAHAWAIPELYARRGANVVRRRPRAEDGPERMALGLLGDLVGHDARELHARTGLVPERGALGVWLVAEAGAVLVAHGGRRIFCWCVQVPEPGLPSGDRIAHLLLALREDEAGFATVANLAFSGAPWRLRRRMPPATRPALDAAVRLARVSNAGV